MARLLLLALLLAGPHRPRAELLVHAAASLTAPLRELGDRFERRTGERVALSLGGSGALARQIAEGAPGDLFFSADEASLDRLAQAGLLLAGTRRSLLGNSLVAVVRRDSPLPLAGPRDLLDERVTAVSVGEPQSVPAGIYARAALGELGVWEALVPKLVPTDNDRAALAAVESGNVEAGLVYRTDAASSARLRVAFALPESPAMRISYPVAVLAGTARPEAARRLLDYLSSEEAAAVFRRHGFRTLTTSRR